MIDHFRSGSFAFASFSRGERRMHEFTNAMPAILAATTRHRKPLRADHFGSQTACFPLSLSSAIPTPPKSTLDFISQREPGPTWHFLSMRRMPSRTMLAMSAQPTQVIARAIAGCVAAQSEGTSAYRLLEEWAFVAENRGKTDAPAIV